jgi:hypothetical protein
MLLPPVAQGPVVTPAAWAAAAKAKAKRDREGVGGGGEGEGEAGPGKLQGFPGGGSGRA